MTNPQLVLASASPRRSELLASIGLTFTVDPPDIDETPEPGEIPRDYVRRLSQLKAAAISGDIVIAADTTVVLGDSILGKPTDTADARRILQMLSGSPHEVLTGVTVRAATESTTAVVSTIVEFIELEAADIEWYVDSGEPMDKAGAYAIQGAGGSFVRRISGSVTNVIGLPVAETISMLAELGHPATSLRT